MGRKSYRNGVWHILGKQKPLRLNHEEVQKLMKIIHDTIHGFLWQSVVTTRTDLRGKAIAKDKFANHLGRSSYFEESDVSMIKDAGYITLLTSKGDIGRLEHVANNRKISKEEDQSYREQIGNGSRSGILPL